MSSTSNPAAEPAALYRLESEQVAFLTQLLDGLQLSGNPAQVRKTLALVDGIQAALSSPVKGEE